MDNVCEMFLRKFARDVELDSVFLSLVRQIVSRSVRPSYAAVEIGGISFGIPFFEPVHAYVDAGLFPCRCLRTCMAFHASIGMVPMRVCVSESAFSSRCGLISP